MTEILPNIFALEIPKGSTALAVMPLANGKCVLAQGHIVGTVGQIELPTGNWKALFSTKNCSEEQAATLPMEDSGINFGYKDYEGKQSSHFYADHALMSLLRFNGLDANKNYLLLKKTTPPAQ